MSNLNHVDATHQEPSEAEINFFINEMISFVESRSAAVSEQEAIDNFLEYWRSSIRVRPQAEVIELRRAG